MFFSFSGSHLFFFLLFWFVHVEIERRYTRSTSKAKKSVLYYGLEMKQKKAATALATVILISFSVCLSVCRYTLLKVRYFSILVLSVFFFTSFGCYINYFFCCSILCNVSFSLPLSNIRSNIYKLKSRAYKPIVVHLSIPMMIDHNSFVVV